MLCHLFKGCNPHNLIILGDLTALIQKVKLKKRQHNEEIKREG